MEKDTYYIDFTGLISVEANSKEEAEAKFWEMVKNNKEPIRSQYSVCGAGKEDNITESPIEF